jgi:hypothetical protein
MSSFRQDLKSVKDDDQGSVVTSSRFFIIKIIVAVGLVALLFIFDSLGSYYAADTTEPTPPTPLIEHRTYCRNENF